jgi:hypothetical protein
MFIEESSHLLSKTYITRVEGENTRLRHYLARLHHKTLCYSKSVEMLRLSTLTPTLPKVQNCHSPCQNHDLIVQRRKALLREQIVSPANLVRSETGRTGDLASILQV